MRISEQGVSLIKKFEGLRLTAYKCPTGYWTIGWGHTYGVKSGQKITKEQAEVYLKQDLVVAEDAVDKLVSTPLNQGMYDALVSFVFNLGAVRFKNSTLLRRLNQGAYDLVPDEFLRWVYGTVDGKTQKLPGLVERRTAEKEMFVKAYEAEKPKNE